MQNQKLKALKAQSILNAKADIITDPIFHQYDFFDPYDLLQVKYEMLRRVLLDGNNIAQTARQFGFSRTTFYKLLTTYQSGGLAGLLPQEKGPQKAHKFSSDVVAYIHECMSHKPAPSTTMIANKLKKQFGLTVHPRSVERILKTTKKKR